MLKRTAFEKKYGVKFTTKHTGKMKGIVSLSTSVLCNPECTARRKVKGTICEHCYSAAMHSRYSGLAKMLAKNTEVLTSVLIPIEDLPIITAPYGRFESFADLQSAVQAANYLNIARYNPGTKWALWTKNPWYIHEALKKYGMEKPVNLTIIFSSYFVNQPMQYDAAKYWFIDKVFTVYDKAYAVENQIDINCGARSCATCLRCYENYGGSVVNELLK